MLQPRHNPVIASTTPDLKTTRWGTVVINENGRTSKARVWAGGKIVSGGATVISAMGEGRVAAIAMHEYLSNGAKKIVPPSPQKAE